MKPKDSLKNISLLIPSNYLDQGAKSPMKQCVEVSEEATPVFHVDFLQQQHLLHFSSPRIQGLFRYRAFSEERFSGETAESLLEILSDPATAEDFFQEERKKLQEIKQALGDLPEGDPEISKSLMDEIEVLGNQYLYLAKEIAGLPEADENTYTQLNQLAQEVFLTLVFYSGQHKDPKLQIQSLLYYGYLEMARGDLDSALALFEAYQKAAFTKIGDGNADQGEKLYRFYSGGEILGAKSSITLQQQAINDQLYLQNQESYRSQETVADFYRKGLATVDGIQKQIQQDETANLNLFYLNVWETVAKETYQKKMDEAEGIMGETFTFMEELLDAKTTKERIKERFEMEMATIANLRAKLLRREAVTLAEARDLLENSSLVYDGDYEILLDYILPDPDRPYFEKETQATQVLQLANMMESRYDLPQGAYALYTLLSVTEAENAIGSGALEGVKALEDDGSLSRGLVTFLAGFSTDELVTDSVLLMAGLGMRNLGAKAVGNLLSKSSKLKKLAPFLIWGAGVATEAAILTTYQFTTASWKSDPEKVWTKENLVKWGVGNLMLLGFARGFGYLGKQADKALFGKNPVLEKALTFLGVVAGRNVNEFTELWDESYGGERYSIGRDLGKFFHSWGAGNFLKQIFPKYRLYLQSQTTDVGTSDPGHDVVDANLHK